MAKEVQIGLTLNFIFCIFKNPNFSAYEAYASAHILKASLISAATWHNLFRTGPTANALGAATMKGLNIPAGGLLLQVGSPRIAEHLGEVHPHEGVTLGPYRLTCHVGTSPPPPGSWRPCLYTDLLGTSGGRVKRHGASNPKILCFSGKGIFPFVAGMAFPFEGSSICKY